MVPSMRKDGDDVDAVLLVTLARLGETDRELYRQLRAEAWEMVAQRHRGLPAAARADWLRKAS